MKALFNQGDINRMFAKRMEAIKQLILERFRFIGETFIRLARENGEYNDVTGNLRSSIGYLILEDGNIVAQNFEGKQSEGKAKGEAFAQELASRHPTGFVLIVVAGMEYAAQVESRGKDVLTGSSIIAEQLLREAIAIISGKVSA